MKFNVEIFFNMLNVYFELRITPKISEKLNVRLVKKLFNVIFFQAWLFCGHLCITFAAAFLLSLAFESPMMGLERILLGRAKSI